MSHPVLEAKELRSYERSRQNHLHPSDRLAAKRSKRHKPLAGGNSTKQFDGRPLSGVKWVDPVTSDDLALHPDLDYVGPDEEDGRWEVDEPPNTHIILPELNLADLIRPPRMRKGIARDYEFVPRVRTVMIIEHGLSNSDSESESEDGVLDWEVVPDMAKCKDRRAGSRQRPTYAAVARTK